MCSAGFFQNTFFSSFRELSSDCPLPKGLAFFMDSLSSSAVEKSGSSIPALPTFFCRCASDPHMPWIFAMEQNADAQALSMRKFLPFRISTASILSAIFRMFPGGQKKWNGAKGCGMELGVYFFSQAISVTEAIEEANWVLEHLKNYPVTLPVVFDWEKVDADNARTADLDVTTLTDCAVAFCETIRRAGYEPCIYYNRTTGYYRYDLTRLTNYKVWLALPCNPPDLVHPSFYYHIDMWQYSITGQVPGISVETDLDYIFDPIPIETTENPASQP